MDPVINRLEYSHTMFLPARAVEKDIFVATPLGERVIPVIKT
jgi:hypothetical protein